MTQCCNLVMVEGLDKYVLIIKLGALWVVMIGKVEQQTFVIEIDRH